MIAVRELPAPPVCRREVLRYMGARENAEMEALLDRAIALCEGKLRYRVCYREVAVACTGDARYPEGLALTSATLGRALAGCDRAVLFAATVGLELDRLILTYSRTSPALALCLQAYGAERVEALCDAFCEEFSDATPRVSPGYGDFPIEAQGELFRLLDCPRKIGLSLNESLLMTPTKSVTAVFGRKENYEHS
ncbi:MAG: Vitamin B12 dependent methionine synthase activation subunit [Clostridia bacterium]|nr:Vitamin B12 dependent methionine synthase activation subunit [Clostridia bacterium]